MPDVVDGVDEFIATAAGLFQRGMRGDYTPVLRKIMLDLQDRHRGLFDFESAPTGEPWPELAESTIERKGHDRILYESGRLLASLAEETGDSIREIVSDVETPGFSFGTSVPYSIYHQYGTQTLDQREHVGANDNMVDQMVEDIADHIAGSIVLGPLN